MKKFLLIPLLLLPFAVSATSGNLLSEPAEEGGEATVTVTQENTRDDGTIGSWTLIRPGNDSMTLNHREEYSRDDSPTGKYTIIATPPKGASTELQIFLDGNLVKTDDSPQAGFNVHEGTVVHVHLVYTYTRTGKVSVGSSPPGLDFTLSGPDNWSYTGVTPYNDLALPEGLYSVKWHDIDGCATPKPQSDRLETAGRVDIFVEMVCDNLDVDVMNDYNKQLQHVTVNIDGETITLEDVGIDEWFAPFVHKAAKTGIISGYTDADGNPTGRYGPTDNVTIAQLAKIAAEMTGLDVEKVRGSSYNERAHNQWFEKYFILAEQNHWQVYRDVRLDPGRPATRAEVIATITQAFDVPRVWPQGDMFADVQPHDPYAASIETAASYEVIGGYSDATFRPNNSINRAEIAKIIAQAIEKY